jgi:hypothetical protein
MQNLRPPILAAAFRTARRDFPHPALRTMVSLRDRRGARGAAPGRAPAVAPSFPAPLLVSNGGLTISPTGLQHEYRAKSISAGVKEARQIVPVEPLRFDKVRDSSAKRVEQPEFVVGRPMWVTEMS